MHFGAASADAPPGAAEGRLRFVTPAAAPSPAALCCPATPAVLWICRDYPHQPVAFRRKNRAMGAVLAAADDEASVESHAGAHWRDMGYGRWRWVQRDSVFVGINVCFGVDC